MTSVILDKLTPQHKPTDLLTTDAGPGVRISERVVLPSMTDRFLLNDLDSQVRALHAPQDSKSHKVEHFMSNLNDACGKERFLSPPALDLLDMIEESELLKPHPPRKGKN